MTADTLFTADDANQQTGQAMLFSFGDPEPVLSTNVSDYLGIFTDVMGNYYRPPVDLMGLSNLMNANAYHGPILHFKKNMLCKWYQPTPFLSSHEFKRAALDYVVTGNAYLQKFYNSFGQVIRLGWLPALSMRPSRKSGVFVKLLDNSQFNIGQQYIEYQPGEVIHLKEPDIKQSLFGIPQYFGGIQSVLLSEDATLFRRKFYLNGAHMGYILVTADANLDSESAKAIEKAVRDSKGPGNFRSVYINVPRSNGNKEPVKIIPVGSIGNTKDEFSALKEVTEMEMLAMHRVYPGLAAIIPANVGGFGDMQKSMQVYHELEVTAMQQVFLEVNEQISGQPIRFTQPNWQVA